MLAGEVLPLFLYFVFAIIIVTSISDSSVTLHFVFAIIIVTLSSYQAFFDATILSIHLSQ
jgi:hypothetical protein